MPAGEARSTGCVCNTEVPGAMVTRTSAWFPGISARESISPRVWQRPESLPSSRTYWPSKRRSRRRSKWHEVQASSDPPAMLRPPLEFAGDAGAIFGCRSQVENTICASEHSRLGEFSPGGRRRGESGIREPVPHQSCPAREHERGTHAAQHKCGASAHRLHQESSPRAESRSRYSWVVSSPLA